MSSPARSPGPGLLRLAAAVLALGLAIGRANPARADVIDFDPRSDSVPDILSPDELGRYNALVGAPVAGVGIGAISPDGKRALVSVGGAVQVMDTVSAERKPLDTGGLGLSGIFWLDNERLEAFNSRQVDGNLVFTLITVDLAKGTVETKPAGSPPPGYLSLSTNLIRLPDGRRLIPMLLGPPGMAYQEAVLTVERPIYDSRSPEERAALGLEEAPLEQAQVPIRLVGMDAASGAITEIGTVAQGENPAVALGSLRQRPGASTLAWLTNVSIPWAGKNINGRTNRGGGMPISYWNVQETLGRLKPEENFHLTKTTLHLKDLVTGDARDIANIDHDPGKFSSLFWPVDGSFLAVLCQMPSVLKGRQHPIYEYAAGVAVKRFSPEGQPMGSWSRPEMSALSTGFSAFGSALASGLTGTQAIVVYGANTTRHLALVDLADDQKAPRLLYAGDRMLGAWAQAGETLLAFLSDATDPGELNIASVPGEGSVGSFRAVTDVNAAARSVSNAKFATFSYTTSDGVALKGSYIYPGDWSFPPEKPQPAIVWQEGGPGGHMVNSWGMSVESPRTLLPNFGIPVIVVNGAGRNSNGQAFYSAMADGTNFGQQDIKDVKEAVEHLVGLGWVKADAVGVTGCSYGGYFTLQSLATYPNTYRAGNAQCSLNDMMYEFNFGWSPFLAYLLGDTPTGNPQEYIKDSPTYNAYKIESPLLVFHGTLDFLFFEHLTNVHDQVLANGVPARYFRPIGYGHGIGGVTDPATGRGVPNAAQMGQRFAFQLQLDWFRRHLGLKPALAFDQVAASRYRLSRLVSPLEGLAPRLTIPGLPGLGEVR